MKTMMACVFAAMAACAQDFRPAGQTGADVQRAVDACVAAGGGRVVVPAGDYPSQSIRLGSNVDLHLEAGARLVGSVKPDDYFDIPESVTRVMPEKSRKAFLYAWNATNVTISGQGTIDGMGPQFFDRSVPTRGFWPKPKAPRPRMLQLVDCRGVRLAGVTFKDSPGWTMLIRFCEDVDIDGIVIDNDQRMINSDGIDVDACRNVHIARSRLTTGDDGIILRAIGENGRTAVCENVLVEDCELNSACQSVRIGCPSDEVIRHSVFRNIRGSGYNGINFENPVRYLRADDEGSADMSDIVFEGFRGTFRNRAIQITAGPGVKIRGVRNVVFRDFDVQAKLPLRFWGNADSVFSDIRLENVRSAVTQPGPAYEARAVEPLTFAGCTFNGERVADRTETVPRGRREPLVRGRIGARIGENFRLIREDDWYGYRRIVFDFRGEEAWVVLPKGDVPRDVPWTWTMEWPTAFVRRTGALAMLERGWPHVTLRPGHFEADGVTFVHEVGNMNDARVAASRAFQKFLFESLAFGPKATLIGMSLGGFYSLRYAAVHPECVGRIYLDAPVCDLTTSPKWPSDEYCAMYGVTRDWVGKDDPRMPVNTADVIAKAGIEVLLMYGGQDQTISPAKNCELWAARFVAAGGRLQNGIADEDGRGRANFGHHPHGLEIDQQDKLARFFEHGVADGAEK